MLHERQVHRTRVLLRADVLTSEGTIRARVRDISPSGVQLSTQRQLNQGEDLIFVRGQTFVAAKVAWSTNENAGLEFYRPLSQAEIGTG